MNWWTGTWQSNPGFPQIIIQEMIGNRKHTHRQQKESLFSSQGVMNWEPHPWIGMPCWQNGQWPISPKRFDYEVEIWSSATERQSWKLISFFKHVSSSRRCHQRSPLFRACCPFSLDQPFEVRNNSRSETKKHMLIKYTNYSELVQSSFDPDKVRWRWQ